jgi:tRNA 2-thiouridine synthesizing protein B
MAILHLVCRSPFESDALTRCLERAGAEDAVLLMENAVYAVLKEVPANGKLYALLPDLEARGLDTEAATARTIQLVDYEGFVELTERYPLSLSWY